MTGADYKVAMIQVYLYLLQQDVNKNILILIETAVTISKLAYLPEKDRCAHHILQFYNATWLHHELCRKLFLQFHAGMTRKRFFRSYLHALVVHAPVQFELISLRSIQKTRKDFLVRQGRVLQLLLIGSHKTWCLQQFLDFKLNLIFTAYQQAYKLKVK